MLNAREYVIATFDPEEVAARLREDYPALLDHLNEDGLMDKVVMSVVKDLQDWYDETSGDTVREFFDDALAWLVDEEVLEEVGYEV